MDIRDSPRRTFSSPLPLLIPLHQLISANHISPPLREVRLVLFAQSPRSILQPRLPDIQIRVKLPRLVIGVMDRYAKGVVAALEVGAGFCFWNWKGNWVGVGASGGEKSWNEGEEVDDVVGREHGGGVSWMSEFGPSVIDLPYVIRLKREVVLEIPLSMSSSTTWRVAVEGQALAGI